MRHAPTYRGYEASACCVIRRAETSRITKTGKIAVLPAKVIKRSGRNAGYVQIDHSTTPWMAVLNDAWPIPDDGRPECWYHDGQVRTVAEVNARWLATRS